MNTNFFRISMLIWILLICFGVGQNTLTHPAGDPETGKKISPAKLDSLVSVMTLEEKLGQLTQYSGSWDKYKGAEIGEAHRQLLREGRVGSFLNVYGAELTRELQQIAVEETRLGIPLIFGFDVIHGFQTTFPVPLAEASSWDTALVRQAARHAALEATAVGLHWTFAPMVDIARDPRWGRIVEGSGEDTFLGSAMAAARVRGFQGQDLSAPYTLLACVKHFTAYGAAEGGRDYNTVDISERTLREIYLPPFKAAIDAGAGSLMAAFNDLNGIPCSANSFILNDILRTEWGFGGMVVSDWNSVGEIHIHRLAETRAEAGKMAIEAGVDMDMESNIYPVELLEYARQGKVQEAVIDRAVKRVLEAKWKLGLFDDPYRYCNAEAEQQEILNPAHRQAAREMARESIVLLKNEKSLLPLKKDLKTLVVIGPLADNRQDPLGAWAQVGRPEDVVTVLEGVRKAVSPSTKILFEKGCEIDGDSEAGFEAAVKAARRADVALLVVGESADMSGEAQSRSTLNLPGVQEKLVKAVYQTGTPVVVILMNGRPLSIGWIAENIPAILETWFLGLETGHAIADVLFGDVNPSGKLPLTFPRTVGQVPFYYNHKNTGRPAVDGLPYNSRYLDVASTPLFPFGFGLSYTTFNYSELKLSADAIPGNSDLIVTAEVTNTGERAGKEVVQLYICDEYGSVTRPVKELKGFRKIFLNPGETQKVEFTLTPEHLAMYNREMQRVVEPGTFKVFVGGNSVDVLTAEFRVTESPGLLQTKY